MNNYKVTHHHDRIFNATSNVKPTVYAITADSPREAAIIAHGIYNGHNIDVITDDSIQPFRTIHDQFVDSVVPSPIGTNTDIHSVFLYDGISGHVIIVDRLD